MWAEIIAYMIYSEGPEYPEYAMPFLLKVFQDPQISEYVCQIFFQSVLFSNRKLPKVLGAPRTQENVMHFFSQKVFPGILQVIIPTAWHPGQSFYTTSDLVEKDLFLLWNSSKSMTAKDRKPRLPVLATYEEQWKKCLVEKANIFQDFLHETS